MPHSTIQVELGFILQAGTCEILNFAQNPRQNQSVQVTELNWGVYRKSVYQEGRTPHIFSEQGANRGGTPHIKTGIFKLGGGWPGGWLLVHNKTTSWLHLGFSAKLRIWQVPEATHPATHRLI